MIKTVAYSVDEAIEMMCSVCELEQQHTVKAVTKQGKIVKAVCSVCETASTFSRGVKTAVSVGKSKNTSPYDRIRKYRKGQTMVHDKFGRGEVTAVMDQKIDVLFGDETRRLIHAQQ